jgi:hypothetical protein
MPIFAEMMIGDSVAVVGSLVFAFGAWCVRVELRLNKERQSALALDAALHELRRETKAASDDLHHHGEMLASIKASVDFMALGLRDMTFRLERLGERTL